MILELGFSDMAVSAEPSVQAPGTRLKVKQWIFAGIQIWFEVVDAAMELPIIHDAASAASALVNYVGAVSVHFYWIESSGSAIYFSAVPRGWCCQHRVLHS